MSTPFQRLRLDGRVAVVTGGGSDIGAAIAGLLAARGATTIIADLRADAANRIAQSVGAAAIACQVDVGDEGSVAALVEAAASGSAAPTLLVNVAAINTPEQTGKDMAIATMDSAIWDRAFAINVRGAMLATKHILPHMIAAGGGAIVNISSTAAILSLGSVPAYSASKAAMHSLTTSTATAYGPAGVRCNTVAPGLVETSTTSALGADFLAMSLAHNVLPRLGRPADIAEMVAFLLSDASGYVTGQLVAVDGGQTTHLPIADDLRAAGAGKALVDTPQG